MKIENCKLKIILLSFIFYLLSSAFIVQNASAQTNQQTKEQNPYTQPNTNPDVPKNLHTYTQNVIIEVMSAATCQLAGIDPTNPNQQCLGVDQKTGKIGFVKDGGGAIGVMSHMISMLYTIPIHTGDYTHYLAQNFGITKKAYAQGTGFEGLKPLLGLWTAFRNIVYLIFTVVFVVIGLLIMFRIKIDPRTVMTIQNQIPKIIIGIVLVTFSYAIAGFLIDIMYGSIYLIGNVMTSATKQSPAVVTSVVQSSDPFTAASKTVGLKDVTWGPAKAAGEFISPVFDNAAGKTITGIIAVVAGTQIRKAAVGVANGGKSILKFFKVLDELDKTATDIPKFVPWDLGIGVLTGLVTEGGLAFFGKDIDSLILSSVAFLIIAIAILWALFRLWFALIMAYIYILIGVVLAPFWVAAGIFPGIPINFTGWLRWMMARVAAFPTTIALFLLGKAFIDAFGTTQTAGQFVPPLIGNPTSTNAIGALIGLGIIFLSSNVANMTQRMFNAPKIDLGRIGQALGAGTGITGIPGKMGQVGLMLGGMQNIPGLQKIPGLSKLIGTRGGGGGTPPAGG